MMVRKTEVALSARRIITNADFADAFEMLLPGSLIAMDVSHATVNSTLTWIRTMIRGICL